MERNPGFGSNRNSDNFFDLGRDYLFATHPINRVLGKFNLNLSLKPLFGSTTIAQMAIVVEHPTEGQRVGKS
jgi:hypothetical protein